MYSYGTNGWEMSYAENLTEAEKNTIYSASAWR